MIHLWFQSLISGWHWTSSIQSHRGLTRNTCIYNYHPRYARMNKSKYFITHWLLCISAVELKNIHLPVCLITHTDMTGFSCKCNKTLSGRGVVIIIQINLILRTSGSSWHNTEYFPACSSAAVALEHSVPSWYTPILSEIKHLCWKADDGWEVGCSKL